MGSLPPPVPAAEKDDTGGDRGGGRLSPLRAIPVSSSIVIILPGTPGAERGPYRAPARKAVLDRGAGGLRLGGAAGGPGPGGGGPTRGLSCPHPPLSRVVRDRAGTPGAERGPYRAPARKTVLARGPGGGPFWEGAAGGTGRGGGGPTRGPPRPHPPLSLIVRDRAGTPGVEWGPYRAPARKAVLARGPGGGLPP